MTERMMTTAQLAEYLGYRPQTIRAMRTSGRGPRYVRPGGGRGPCLYRESDVREWLDRHTHDHTAAEYSQAS